VAILLSGLRVGNLYEGQKVFDVVVWGVPELRRSMTDIRDLMIDTPDGQVRLGDVADVRIVPSPVIIKRDSVSRFIDVTATVSGRNFNAVLADVQSRLQGIEFPIEHHSEILGNSAEQRAGQQRILVFGIAALVGIFLVLQASFRSWHLAVSAFVTLPVALSGGALAAFLAGGVSLGSLFGFLVIIGITVRNGLLLTHHWRHLELEEGENFGPELVLRGARERLKPILMSVFGSIAVLLPIVVAGNLPGLEIVRPMAIVILGGLVTTTLLNLVITPILYLQYGTRREPELNLDLAPSPAAD
jgi:Cu/Ag efflux pump CusA